MGAITQQPQILMEAMARLERQNRMLKRGGFFLFFLCFVAIGLIAWQVKRMSRVTAAQGQPRIISANQFNLMDENGKMQGMLAGSSGGATLFLNGPNNKAGLMFTAGPGHGSSLSLISSNREQEVTLNTEDTFSWVTVGTNDSSGDRVQITAGGGSENLTVSDKAGFQAVLGRASLVKPDSGETRNTSVAALTLFGKDGRVIWMTPRP